MSNANHIALDPSRSVVVEACAGSGKTWLLVSRIVRLLMDGAKPSQILAITFTRKAAQEMQARLQLWLRELAMGDDASVRKFFAERGLPSMTGDQMKRARGLYGAVLLSQPGITISTFHGWFMQVLQRAPLNAEVVQGTSLLDREGCVQDEAWEELLDSLRKNPDSDVANQMRWLFNEYGLFLTRKMLDSFLAKRSEWKSYTQGQPKPLEFALADLRADLDVNMNVDPVPMWGTLSENYDALTEFAFQIGKNGTAAQLEKAAELDRVWMGSAAENRFDMVFPLMFTQAGEPRKLKSTKNQDDSAFMAALAALQDSLQAVRDIQEEQQAYRLNEALLHCGVELLARYEALKTQKQQIDFADLEWQLSVLLQDSTQAETMQFKLDSRYRHVLLDEFQDTNPLQWHIMRSWFDASVAVENQPKVFVVGDPKQSIYRFRRADSRLFGVAREYLKKNFGAVALGNSLTRRNAQPIVDVVNAVFVQKPAEFDHVDHTTTQTGLPGHVMALPLVVPDEKPDVQPQTSVALRDPLTTPREEVEEVARQKEATQFSETLQTIVKEWAVQDGAGERRARYGDIMVLVRNRTHLTVYEKALHARNIPFISSRRGGLLETLEASDIQALLLFLITPFADLALAQVLRTPIFACSDEDLMSIAQASPAGADAAPESWWERLQKLPAPSRELTYAVGLLKSWLDLSDRMPVHDLLDRIFAEGDVHGRYAAAVPQELRAKVLANLNAFMEVALSVDAGRYPSLPHFLQELRDLRENVDDAPDEGKLGTIGNAVRIYTVHEAKGLEAPIVWLLDSNAEKMAKDGYDVLVDWPAHLPQPLHFSIYASPVSRGKKRGQMFDHEESQQAREEMNLLYVAMTRAKQALIVSGISKGEDKELKKKSPSWYDRIAVAAGGQPNPLHKPVQDAAGVGIHDVVMARVTLPTVLPVGVRKAANVHEMACA